jgi:hypothetical protein
MMIGEEPGGVHLRGVASRAQLGTRGGYANAFAEKSQQGLFVSCTSANGHD